MLTDILSRLVETAAEQGEDMQGYVTELVLTLEASVESLETDFRPMDVARDIFKSTPNLNNKECGSPFLERATGANLTRRHAFYGRTHLSAGNAPYSHIRSTSYTAACGDKKAAGNDLKGLFSLPIDYRVSLIIFLIFRSNARSKQQRKCEWCDHFRRFESIAIPIGPIA